MNIENLLKKLLNSLKLKERLSNNKFYELYETYQLEKELKQLDEISKINDIIEYPEWLQKSGVNLFKPEEELNIENIDDSEKIMLDIISDTYESLYLNNEGFKKLDFETLIKDDNGLLLKRLKNTALLIDTIYENNFTVYDFPYKNIHFYDDKILINWKNLSPLLLGENQKIIDRYISGRMHPGLRQEEASVDNKTRRSYTVWAYRSLIYQLLLGNIYSAPLQIRNILLNRYKIIRKDISSHFGSFFNERSHEQYSTCIEFYKYFEEFCNYKYPAVESTFPYTFYPETSFGNKASKTNEDVVFHLQSKKSMLFGVADGVSTADLGTGRIAARQLILELESNRDYWETSLNSIISPSDDIKKFKNESEQVLQDFINKSNERIVKRYNQIAKEGEIYSNPMSSTVTVGIITNNAVVIAVVGDSRAYLLNRDSGTITRLTEDQNIEKRELVTAIKSGKYPKSIKDGTVLTNVLGNADFTKLPYTIKRVIPDFEFITLKRSDNLLFCTDGLFSPFSNERTFEEAMRNLLIENRDTRGNQLGFKFINEAIDKGGGDNISLILISPDLSKRS